MILTGKGGVVSKRKTKDLRERDERRKPRHHIDTIMCKKGNLEKLLLTQGAQSGAPWGPRGGAGEGREAEEGGGRHVIMPGCCKAGASKTL